MAITPDQIDALEAGLIEVALTKSIAYGDKRVDYRDFDDAMRAYLWAKGQITPPAGAGAAGSGSLKFATCATKGYRPAPPGSGSWGYKTSGDFYALRRPWSQP